MSPASAKRKRQEPREAGGVEFFETGAPRNFYPLKSVLSETGLDAADYVASLLEGDAPAPFRIGEQLYIDSSMWSAWRARLALKGREDQKAAGDRVWRLA